MRYLIIFVLRDPRDEKYHDFMEQLREWEATPIVPPIYGGQRENTSSEELGNTLLPLLCPGDGLLVTELERYVFHGIPEMDSF